MKHLLALIIFVFAFPAGAQQTAISTVNTSGTTTAVSQTWPGAALSVASITWTSDAGGDAIASLGPLVGELVRVVTNPSDGATSPTASYDVTLTDQDGIDVLAGRAADRSATASESFTPMSGDTTTSTPMALAGTHTLTVDNAGAARSGVLRLYLRRN